MSPLDAGGAGIDSRGLERLRSQARDDPRATARAAAKQFEAVFLQQVLKQMRAALPQGDFASSSATRMQTELFDQQLADRLAQRGTGLAEALTRHLERALARTDPKPDPAPAAATIAAPPASSRAAVLSPPAAAALAPPRAAAASAPLAAPAAPATAGKQGFIEKMLGHAEAAAKSLRVPSAFVIGQAALESAWGQREIRGADGAPSHNLFGIKATGGWTGRVVEATTTEVIGGVARRVVDRFRAYDSYGEAFADYTRLLLRNPRYGAAVGAPDAEAFARGLQEGGYATDPAYARKLSTVIGSVGSSLPGAGR